MKFRSKKTLIISVLSCAIIVACILWIASIAQNKENESTNGVIADNSIKSMSQSDEQIIENFKTNIDYFDDVANYIKDNYDTFACVNGSSEIELRINSTDVNISDVEKHNEILHLFNDLGYQAIYLEDDWVTFIKQGKSVEVGIVCMKDNKFPTEHGSGVTFTVIEKNWYLYKLKLA